MMDFTCILSALLFLAGNLLITIAAFKDRGSFDEFEKYKSLDAEYLQRGWGIRSGNAGLSLSGEIIVALAWFVFTIPILQLSWILSRGGKRKLPLHSILVMLVVGGSFSELIARLLQIGTFSIMGWMTDEFNLSNWMGGSEADDIGWRTIEVVRLAVIGMTFWVDAFEWLAMFGIFTVIVISVETLPESTRVFSKFWSRLGILLAICSIVEFVADVLRLTSWNLFQPIAAIVSLFTTTILLPLWLGLLGSWLPLATPEYKEKEEEIDFYGKPVDVAVSVASEDKAQTSPKENFEQDAVV